MRCSWLHSALLQQCVDLLHAIEGLGESWTSHGGLKLLSESLRCQPHEFQMLSSSDSWFLQLLSQKHRCLLTTSRWSSSNQPSVPPKKPSCRMRLSSHACWSSAHQCTNPCGQLRPAA